MPSTDIIEAFIAMVEANQHVQAVETFYIPDAILQDNQSNNIRGKQKQIENEKNLLLKIKKMSSRCIRPYFINGEQVVIKWHFKFEFKNDTYIVIDEVTWQQWLGEQIQKEQFFFDPQQFVPKSTNTI